MIIKKSQGCFSGTCWGGMVVGRDLRNDEEKIKSNGTERSSPRRENY